jgi:hypothetical protein
MFMFLKLLTNPVYGRSRSRLRHHAGTAFGWEQLRTYLIDLPGRILSSSSVFFCRKAHSSPEG